MIATLETDYRDEKEQESAETPELSLLPCPRCQLTFLR